MFWSNEHSGRGEDAGLLDAPPPPVPLVWVKEETCDKYMNKNFCCTSELGEHFPSDKH